jgi:hypothetical protein
MQKEEIMKTEGPNLPTSPIVAPNKRLSGEQLTELLKALRRATSGIHSELRVCLAVEGNLFESPPPQAHVRRKQQFEKAYEQSRQAEAKLELLVAHFGGSL